MGREQEQESEAMRSALRGMVAISATVWIATGPTLAQTPDVELNHVYVTLSKGTLDAISKSTVLSDQFSTPEVRTVRSGKESWTGTYLNGWRAYLELFAPGGAEGLDEGCSGIGFSVPRPGSGDAVKRRLDAVPGESALSDLRSIQIDERTNIPWFEELRLKTLEEGPFNTWLMDFRPEFVKYRNIKPTSEGLVDRHAYIAAKYTAPDRKQAYEKVFFDDLLEVDLELTPAEGARFEKFATSLGYAVSWGHGTRSFRRGTFSIVVRVVPNPVYRIRKVICSLRRDAPSNAELTFGPGARLTLQGRRAIWSFGGS
jgi:Family of unknown function (DUF5829)